MEPGFYLDGPNGKADMVIERIEILEEITFRDECRFKTISPLYVKTIRKENEELREVDLYPKDPKFYENLHKNLIQRFNEFYNKAPQDHFDIIEINDVKPKRIKISDGYRRCSLFSMLLQASPELLKFAYDAGLGEKNAMGFGCVDLLNGS